MDPFISGPLFGFDFEGNGAVKSGPHIPDSSGQ